MPTGSLERMAAGHWFPATSSNVKSHVAQRSTAKPRRVSVFRLRRSVGIVFRRFRSVGTDQQSQLIDVAR